MNENQRKILEFLSKCDPSEFITQEKIATETRISPTNVGSECYKLREIKFLEPDGSQIGEKIRYRITTFGQIQLENEDERKKNLSWMKKTTIATIGLLVVTGILAIATIGLSLDSQNQTELFRDQTEILYNQTELFQKDFDYTNRPWIGHLTFKQIGFENSTGHFLSVDEFKKQSDEEDRLFTTTMYVHKIELTNFGKLPATDVKIKRTAVLVEDMNFEYSQFFDFVDSIEIESGAIIMPGETITLDARLPPKYIENPSVYGVKVDYNYLENKHGEFQQIFELKIGPGNRSNHILVHTYTE